jgi:hypothetical protein
VQHTLCLVQLGLHLHNRISLIRILEPCQILMLEYVKGIHYEVQESPTMSPIGIWRGDNEGRIHRGF